MRPAGSFPSPADRDPGGRRPTPVEFAPTRLPSGRGGPFRPPILVGLGLFFLAAAIVKPWEGWSPGATDTAVASPSPAASTPWSSGRPPPSPSPSSSVSRSLLSPPGVPATDWTRVAAALSPHDLWGVSAFLERPDPNGGIRPIYAALTERWEAVRPAPGDGSAGSEASVLVSTDGRPVRALGLTVPPGRTPLDVRVWSVSAEREPRWLDVRPVDPSVAAGHLYLLPPRTDAGWADRWSPGSYRIDVLLGSETVRFTLGLGDPSSGPPPDEAPAVPQPTSPPVPAPDVAWLEQGPFVVADGIGMRVSAALVPELGEAGSWLALAGDGVVPTVASIWLPAVEGIGFVLPGPAALEWAALERIVPGPLSGVLASARSYRQEAGNVATVVFAPSEGGAWKPGTYALDVRWIDEGETVAGRWHITLLPGPGRRSAAWTGLVRAWAPHAGSWGIVTGTADPRQGGPAGSPISHRPQQPGPAGEEGRSLPTESCPAGLLPDPARPVLGVTHRTDTTVTAIRLEPADVVGRTVPTAAALNLVPGLSLVAPAAGERIEPGAYRLVLDTSEGPRTLTVCYAPPR